MPPPIVPFILDVEASGFGSESYPIEIGVALEPGHRRSFLIEPASDWTHWDPMAECVHRITRAVLERHGRPIDEVAGALNAELGGLTLYSDAWVVDKPWLTRLFHAARVPMAFSLSPLECLLPEAQMLLWDASKRQVAAELAAERHRASHDAWVVQETYVRTRHAIGTAAGPIRPAR